MYILFQILMSISIDSKVHSLFTLAEQILQDVKHAEMPYDQLEEVFKRMGLLSHFFNMEIPFSLTFFKVTG